MSQISSGWNATKATAPRAQQLNLTSSSTLDRSRYLRSWINSCYTATRLHRHSATSPLGYIAIRLDRHQGHSAKSPAAHFDEFVYSGQVTLPEELDQLRLYCHSATLPLGYIAIRLERHQCHSARSPATHLDEFIYSGQVTLPEELDQLRLYCHSATSPLGYIAIRLKRHQGHSARSPAAHFDEFVYSGQTMYTRESNQLRQINRLSPTVHMDELYLIVRTDELFPSIHIDELLPAVHMDELYLTVCTDELFPSIHIDELLTAVHMDELYPTVRTDELFPSIHIDELLPAVHMDELYPSVHIDKLFPTARIDDLSQKQVVQPEESIRLTQVS